MPKTAEAVDHFEMAMILIKRVGRGRWKVRAIVTPRDDTPEQAFTVTINPRSPQARAFTDAVAGLEALAAEQDGER